MNIRDMYAKYNTKSMLLHGLIIGLIMVLLKRIGFKHVDECYYLLLLIWVITNLAIIYIRKQK
jgi:uncharacterized membrane protein